MATARAVLVNWGPTLLFNVALPVLTYALLTDHGVGEVPALLASGVWPVLETGLSLAIRRKVDEFAVFTLIFLGLSIIAALSLAAPDCCWSRSPRSPDCSGWSCSARWGHRSR